MLAIHAECKQAPRAHNPEIIAAGPYPEPHSTMQKYRSRSEKYDPQSMAFLAQLFINPNIDDVASDATVELEKDIFKPTRKRLTPAGANQIFDMLCRQSNQKENRKVERRRRTHLRKFGTSILYKLHNDSGTNSEGQKCKIYARKHIEQIDRECTAGTIKFGKNAKICHFAAKF